MCRSFDVWIVGATSGALTDQQTIGREWNLAIHLVEFWELQANLACPRVRSDSGGGHAVMEVEG